MAKAYLVGGVPRCGKTSVALKAVALRPMFSTSTDSTRYLLRSLSTADHQPALFAAAEVFSESHVLSLRESGSSQSIIDAQNQESEIVWKSVKRVIEGYIAEDLDVLVEGVAILPHLVGELQCDYAAVFLGNSSTRHGEQMLAYARSNRYDWLKTWSDDAIRALAEFTNDYSVYFEEQARKNGMAYFDGANGTFEDTITAATRSLLE